MIFTNICHLFATLEYFFAVKIFRLRNYSYICSEMGISSEENPKKEMKFGGLSESHLSGE